MTTFPDDYIEHWGTVYNNVPAIRERGVLFNTFLLYPDQIMQQVFEEDAMPLLPMQQVVMHKVAAADAEHDALIPATAQRRGGSFIERWRHHCWTPRKHRRVAQ